jgi:hypothetical protein
VHSGDLFLCQQQLVWFGAGVLRERVGCGVCAGSCDCWVIDSLTSHGVLRLISYEKGLRDRNLAGQGESFTLRRILIRKVFVCPVSSILGKRR